MTAKYKLLESINALGTPLQYEIILALLSGLCLLWFITTKFQRSPKPKISNEKLQEKLESWVPDPLVPEVDPTHNSLSPKLISSKIGKRLTIDGKDCLNMGTHNYLGFLDEGRIEENAILATKKYGIGSCGPRGFYGTVDVHLQLEERLAKFMELEEAIVYSYGFSTVASAIPAYCKRRDIIFCDEKVNFAVQKGLDAARSTVKFFKHNSVEDFERILVEQDLIDRKNLKRAEKIRRFLVIEGIYVNTGLLCPLPEMVKLCRKYKLRILLDESVSFGSLGETGKGVTEFFGVPRHEVDVIMGSLEWAMGSIGGFCVGSSFVIEHQRLSGLGYCFSASLPPLLTAAAITAIDIMEEDSRTIFSKLKRNCIRLHSLLGGLEHFELSAVPESPIKHLYLENQLSQQEEFDLLKKISDKCIDNNLAVIMPAYLPTEREMPRLSLRLCVSKSFEEEDLQFAFDTLDKCSRQILSI